MSQELISTNEFGISKYGSSEDFDLVATTSSWLPRLQLFGANSDPVKRGQFPMAHWGLVIQKDQLEDLGPEVDVLPISWRPKAMRMGDGNGNPVSYFNPRAQEFLDIQKDSEQQDSGCMFGPEFLIWVPSVRRFATYFMSSKTSRRQAPELRALMGQGASLEVQLIETQKYSWHGPVVKRVLGQISELPSLEDVKKYTSSFNNPEDSTIEFDPASLENKKEDAPQRVR